jgi:two-component system, LytTR family, response regulator
VSAIRTVLVDDEPLAREGLRLRLRPQSDVEIIAECGSAREAVRVLAAESPDLVFLDIQMPELDGFGVLAALERGALPAVVFVTAHAEHAARAFRVGALDYLVKPYDDATLFESVARARAYVSAVRAADPVPVERRYASRLSVRLQGRIVFLDASQIDWVESAGDAVRIHAGAESFHYSSTMRAMEERLDPAVFVRIHRTAIVAIRMIRALQPYSDGEHVVVLADGTRLPLSRRSRTRVVQALSREP